MAMTAPNRLAVHVARCVGRRPIVAPTACRSCTGSSARSFRTTSASQGPRGADSTPSFGRRPPNADHNTRNARVAPIGLVVGGGVLASAYAIAQSFPDEHSEIVDARPGGDSLGGDDRDPSLPRFRLADVRKHDGSSAEPWIVFGDKVYDITDWVAAHPGGDVILRAAGGSIEPYWKIFSIHNAPHVREILEQYLIGFIDTADLVDGRPAAEKIEDPFEQDPVRDPRLITHTAKPRNAEPPNEELDNTFRTPNGLFYVRNHMWVPVVEEDKADEHALMIELPDGETRKYTLAELKTRFPVHKVTAVLQCSGNRRNDMTRHAGKTNGLQWGVGAISNAEWEGVRLADVLADAGLKVAEAASTTRRGTTTPAADSDSDSDDSETPNPNSLHVQFTGLEAYGSSIPLPKALDPSGDVLLAFGMNGQPLPRDHGYPLRAVVPGTVAARSVKWLSKIVVADEESPSQWQRRDYKSFGPNEGANPDWDRAVSIQEMPITSAITGVWVGDCVRKVPWMSGADAQRKQGGGVVDIAAVQRRVGFTPKDRVTDAVVSEGGDVGSGKETSAEPIAVQGYAYSGGGRGIARVDVSLDGGKTWDQAELLDDCSTPGSCFGNKDWAWKRWRYLGRLPILSLPTSDSSPINTAETTTDKDCESRKLPPQGSKKHCTTLVVKATDEAYNSQPESHVGIYNVRGNLATAWHRVRIYPRCTDNGDGKGVVWSTGETYGCGFRKEADEVREGMLRSAAASKEAQKGK